MKMFRRLLPVLLVSVFVAVCFFSGAQGEEPAEDDRTVLVFMGDMVFDRMIGYKITTYGTQFPFEPVKPFIQDADLVFGNLESPISDRGTAEPGKYCTFRSYKHTVNCMVYADLDAVSLANNHCLDFGPDALNDTLMYLDRSNISYCGVYFDDDAEDARIPRPVILEANGLKFGFLAYTENITYQPHWLANSTRMGPMPLDRLLMRKDIEYTKEKVDVLIVSIHWRKLIQYTNGPCDADRELCRDVIDWGGDIIMGTGPHTVHEVEGYKDGLILYSIGNSAMSNSGSGESLKSKKSFIPRLTLKGKNITSLTLMPTQEEDYRYVPKGTPVTRSPSTGLNITYSQLMGMYTNDVFNTTGEEEEFEKNQWFIWRSGAAWYYKALSTLVFLVSIAVLIFIFYSIFKKKGKSLLNLEEEFNGPSYPQQQPGTHPGGEQRVPQDPGGTQGPGDTGEERLRGGGKGEDSGSGDGKPPKGRP